MTGWTGLRCGLGATVMALVVGCSSPDPTPTATTAAGGAGGAGGGGAAGVGGEGGRPHGIAALSFPAPTPWADPIEDYLQAGYEHVGSWDFARGIHDLVVWQDRLYLGYGDANENLGRVIPISFRYFASHDDPAVTSELASDEEQLDRYRLIADDLFMAGVDATEDAWLGNVYFRQPHADWYKSRTLAGGVHVHDVFDFGAAVWAVGSGATEEEWTAGDIFAHLWRSTDGGVSFEIFDRHDNGGDGDARWVRLLPLGETLYLYGYSTNAMGTAIDDMLNGRLEGSDVVLLEADHPLKWAYVFETDVFGRNQSDAFGVVHGVDFASDPVRRAAWRLETNGHVWPLDELAGSTVVDIYPHEPTGEAVVLTIAGDEYPTVAPAEWQISILVTDDFASFAELVSFTSAVAPSSIAFWRDCLFYGTNEGQVWKAVGTSSQTP